MKMHPQTKKALLKKLTRIQQLDLYSISDDSGFIFLDKKGNPLTKNDAEIEMNELAEYIRNTYLAHTLEMSTEDNANAVQAWLDENSIEDTGFAYQLGDGDWC